MMRFKKHQIGPFNLDGIPLLAITSAIQNFKDKDLDSGDGDPYIDDSTCCSGALWWVDNGIINDGGGLAVFGTDTVYRFSTGQFFDGTAEASPHGYTELARFSSDSVFTDNIGNFIDPGRIWVISGFENDSTRTGHCGIFTGDGSDFEHQGSQGWSIYSNFNWDNNWWTQYYSGRGIFGSNFPYTIMIFKIGREIPE
ncbi:hypothetical protein ACFL6O_01465 [candidate division KSB1 bacterium]